MSVILSPDGAGRNDFHKGSNKAVVRARVSSKNAAGTRYAAQLDYCNSKQPSANPAAANENPTMLTPNGPEWLNLIKGAGIAQKRLRRDLGESKMPEDDESRRIGTEELSTKFVDGSKAPFDLPDDGRRLVDVDDDDSIEWVKKASNSMRHRGVYGYPFGSSVTARLGIRNGNRGSEKRKWKNSGMQWIKRNFDNYDHYDEGNDNYEENGDEESPDNYDDAVQKDGYGDESKRKWSSSAMGWIKRKWGNAGMGWLKRNDDKRKWRNSNLQWVK